MRLLRALVLGEADIAVDAEHRFFRLPRKRKIAGSREREQVGNECHHRAADVRLIFLAPRLEPRWIVVVRELAEELQALCREASEIHPCRVSRLVGSGCHAGSLSHHVRLASGLAASRWAVREGAAVQLRQIARPTLPPCFNNRGSDSGKPAGEAG
jgi:hypothetical protein